MPYAIFDRLSGEQIGTSFPHKEQAWTEAYERKMVIQGRLSERGEDIHMLLQHYEIKEFTE